MFAYRIRSSHNRLPLIHIYGSLGDLPPLATNDDRARGYGGLSDEVQLAIAVRCMQLLGEADANDANAKQADPELIVCDEPLSALDVSIKSQISNLLKDLQRQLQLSLLFISHDLAAVRFSCERVLVLYLGRVMEIAGCDTLFKACRHPYTRALIRAAPIPDPVAARARRSAPLEGEIPSPLFAPSGCVFRTRCPMAIDRCAREIPLLRQVADSQVACHRAEEIGA